MEPSLRAEPLNRETIEKELSLPLTLLPSVDSTNTEARRTVFDGQTEPHLILAEEQTGGRGRMGRSFFSPFGTGIYLSLVFPTDTSDRDTLLLTTAAAVAVWRAVRDVTGISCDIKWINDLYYGGRKVCGILAESFFVEERRYVILGVGVNLCTEDFPSELQESAGSLGKKAKGCRNELAAAMGRELSALISCPMPCGFMEIYRRHSLVLGQEIVYVENGDRREAVAESVDDRGRLTVRHADGSTRQLSSGEISLRLKNAKKEHRT